MVGDVRPIEALVIGRTCCLALSARLMGARRKKEWDSAYE